MQVDVVDIWDEPIRTLFFLWDVTRLQSVNKIILGCFSVFSLSGAGLIVYFGLFAEILFI